VYDRKRKDKGLDSRTSIVPRWPITSYTSSMLVRLVRSHISNFSSDVRLSVRGDIVGHGLQYSAAQLPRGKIRLGLRRRFMSQVYPKMRLRLSGCVTPCGQNPRARQNSTATIDVLFSEITSSAEHEYLRIRSLARAGDSGNRGTGKISNPRAQFSAY
jgi:hypothetical protein